MWFPALEKPKRYASLRSKSLICLQNHFPPFPPSSLLFLSFATKFGQYLGRADHDEQGDQKKLPRFCPMDNLPLKPCGRFGGDSRTFKKGAP